MNIDKCTVEALKVLEQSERAGVKVEHKVISKKSKIIAITAAFAIMMSATSIAANAANPAPITSETVAEAQVNDVYVYTRDYVNVRSTADFTDNILYTLEPKTKVKLLGVDGDWSYIEVYGVKAYIHSHYLSTKELEYTGDCDTDDEEDTLVKEKIAAAKNRENSAENKEEVEQSNYKVDTADTADTADTDEKSEDCMSSADAEIEKCPPAEEQNDYTDEELENYPSEGSEIEECSYSTDDTYYGTTEEGDDVYHNDSGTFDAFSADGYMTAEEFRNYGIVNHNGECFTYYSELVLPREGLEIPGRYTEYEGYVCDGEGYVVLATPDEYTHPRGSTIELPTGRTGKFYDFCPEGSIDVYVNW